MPFVSQAQRGYMHVHHPEIAKRWDKETPKGKLPARKRMKLPSGALASIIPKLNPR